MQNFAVLERLCLFCSPQELVWEARGAWGCLPLLPLPLPLLHKSRSVPCPQLTRPRPGPPFSSPVSSDQLTHAWLCTTELGCVRAPGARTKQERCPRRKCQYGNTRLFTKPVFILLRVHENSRTCFSSWRVLLLVLSERGESRVSVVAETLFSFFLLFASTKESTTCSEIVRCSHTNYSGDS